MTLKDRFTKLMEDVQSRTHLKVEMSPIDRTKVEDYNEDTHMGAFVKLVNNKIVAILELRGSDELMFCAEMESNGAIIGEIVHIIQRHFPRFGVMAPFYHEANGNLYFGKEGLDKLASNRINSAPIPNSTKGTTRYN